MQSERIPLFDDRVTVLDELGAHARRSPARMPFDAIAAAYHEAGHVVVSHRLGIAVRSVEIGRGADGSDGATAMHAPDGSLEGAVRMAPAHWAGLVAQSFSAGRRSWNGVGADIAQVAHSVPEAGLHQSLWFGAITSATELLTDPRAWADVEAVTAGLLAHGRLDASAIEALLSQTGRPS